MIAAAVLALLVAGTLGATVLGGVRAEIIVLSNSAPHVSVIDGQTHQVTRTANLPDFTSWTWNDDNNYFDGKSLWLGMRNPDSNDVEVVLLDLDTLRLVRRIPLGQDRVTLYIGKSTKHGQLFVSKHASGEVAVIDTKTYTALDTVKLPVDGGVACDVDVATGPGTIERVLVPTDTGNTVLSLDAATKRLLGTVSFDGTRPFMLTVSADSRQVWVEERTGSITVLNPRTLDRLARIPTGRTPIIGTFSPDGMLHFTGHAADTIVLAHDTKSFKEVWRANVGTSPDKVGVHPAGTFVYATLSREAALAVIDLRSGKVVGHVALGTNPTGLYVRRL
jgi:DNA-binding beta-propeller fold protein YncE